MRCPACGAYSAQKIGLASTLSDLGPIALLLLVPVLLFSLAQEISAMMGGRDAHPCLHCGFRWTVER